MLATSIRRIKGTCADKACVELACAIITARPCYLLSAPSEMRPGDFVSKSRCKGTNIICNKSSYHKKSYFFNLFPYKNTYFNGTK